MTPALNLLERGERSISIEPRAMDVLVCLARRAGEVVSVDELLSSVWQGVLVGDGSVYVAIKQLRQALAVPGEHSTYIETIPKRGYRLTVPVEHVAPEAAPAAAVPDDVTQKPPRAPSDWRQRTHRPWLLAAGLAFALCAALVPAAFYFFRAPPLAPLMRFEIRLPGYAPDGLSISPNGEHIAYEAVVNGVRQIWIRPIGELAARPLQGTENANNPFWSPDSRQVAFFADGKLKTTDLTGTSVQTIADVLPGVQPAGSWTRDGTILYTSQTTPGAGSHITRVPVAGGAATPVTASEDSTGGTVHLAPRTLPNGDGFLYVDANPMGRSGTLYAASLSSRARVPLMMTSDGSMNPPIPGPNTAYIDGYLLYLQDATLLARPFDVDALAWGGEPMVVTAAVAEFSVSSTGVLVYRAPSAILAHERRLAWYDRRGERLGDIASPAFYRLPRLSPDGRLIAVTVPASGASGSEDVWIIDTQRGTTTRVTSDAAYDSAAIWSRDGVRIAFRSGRGGVPYTPNSIYQRAANGAGADELLFRGASNEIQTPLDWSPDGRYVVFERSTLTLTNSDIWVVPTSGDGTPFPLTESPFRERRARLSSDGRWIAYATNESNLVQIVVRPFPDVDRGQWQVSTRGGDDPRWRGDGRELFYLDPNGVIMAVPVSTSGDAFEFGSPQGLFATGLVVPEPMVDHVYDVTADGERFLINEAQIQSSNVRAAAVAPDVDGVAVNVIVNWRAALDAGRSEMQR